jgi:hypothetical protein
VKSECVCVAGWIFLRAGMGKDLHQFLVVLLLLVCVLFDCST